MTGLLLLFLLADPAVHSATIELEGARAEEALIKKHRDTMIELQRNGLVTMDEYLESQRQRLDAGLRVQDCEFALAEAQGKKPIFADEQRRERRTLIEKLEARRLNIARTNHKAGRIAEPALWDAELRHQVAWIDRNFVDRMAMKGADPRALKRGRAEQRAKVELRTAEKLVEHLRKAPRGRAETLAVQLRKIRAETASKLLQR